MENTHQATRNIDQNHQRVWQFLFLFEQYTIEFESIFIMLPEGRAWCSGRAYRL